MDGLESLQADDDAAVNRCTRGCQDAHHGHGVVFVLGAQATGLPVGEYQFVIELVAKAFGHLCTQHHLAQGFRLGQRVCKSPPLRPLQTLALAFETGEYVRGAAQHRVAHIAVAQLYGDRPLYLWQLRQRHIALVAHVARRASNLEDAVEHEFGGAATGSYDQVHATERIGETALGVLAQLLHT